MDDDQIKALVLYKNRRERFSKFFGFCLHVFLCIYSLFNPALDLVAAFEMKYFMCRMCRDG